MKKKRKNRRSESERPNLEPRLNLKTRYDLYDQDYLHKLSPEELDWLNKFNKEYVSADLDTKNPRKNFHKNKKLKKDCYDRNNSRNRDILTRAKASKQLLPFEDLDNESQNKEYEDYLISKMDEKDAREAIEWLADELEKDEEKLESNLISEQKKE
jgi:hypothetical protein